MQWQVMKNEKFHNKKIWVPTHDNGITPGGHIETYSEIITRKNDKWIPDVKRGWGFVRENPIVRTCAEYVIPAACHGGYDMHHLLFVSWNLEPTSEDGIKIVSMHAGDKIHAGYLGISKSKSAVLTAVKKYMRES